MCTMPRRGSDFDSRVEMTSVSDQRVSPANTGCGRRTLSQPRLMPLRLTSGTVRPVTTASVTRLFISGRRNCVFFAYSVLKWIWLSLLVNSVIQVLSASSSVLPTDER